MLYSIQYLYRDPSEIFRKFFGGVDPFTQDIAVGILGGYRQFSSNGAYRHRRRYTHNDEPQGRNFIRVHNASAYAAGNAGSTFRNRSACCCCRQRLSQYGT